MVLLSSQPYQKTYRYPYLSYIFVMKILAYLVTILVPFLIVYSTPNFYLQTFSSVSSHLPMTYDYRYHITISDATTDYVYTNWFEQAAIKGLTFQVKNYEDQAYYHFKIGWPNSNVTTTIKKVKVVLSFTYTNGSAQSIGFVTAEVSGYQIGEATLKGHLVIQPGSGSQPPLSSSNYLLDNNYDLSATLKELHQKSSYLQYQFQALPINYPSDSLEMDMLVSYGSLQSVETTPSILGQFIWSWSQFLPLFLIFYWITTQSLNFMLREGLVRRTLAHDKDYMEIIRKENQRNQRVRR